MKADVISIFITRKCNLDCPHCLIRKDDYPERNPKWWINQILKTYDYFGKPLVFLYGGEPMVYWKPVYGLLELIDVFNENGIDYAIQSNSTMINEKTAELYVQHGLKNWSVSIDPPHIKGSSKNIDYVRSQAGYKALLLFKRYSVRDLHATITIYPTNYMNLVDVLKELIKLNVWIEPTIVMWRKGRSYDAFPSYSSFIGYKLFKDWFINAEKYARKIHEQVKILFDYPKFNGTPKMWSVENIVKMIRAEYVCKGLKMIHLDSDGYSRLCRDIAGRRVRRYTLLDIMRNEKRYIRDWFFDKLDMCKGCNWTCRILSDMGWDNFEHR